MKKIITFIFLILIFFVIYFLQVNFFNWFTIAGVKPNIFIIFIVVIGAYTQKIPTSILSIFFGIYLDIINAKTVGSSAFLFTIIGNLSQTINKNISNENKITLLINIMAGTVLYEMLNYFYMCFKFSNKIEFITFSKIVAIEVFFNIIITIILYPIIQKAGNILKKIFEKDNMFSIKSL